MCSKEAMKGILVLLVLLSAQMTKVCCLPYEADSEGNCRSPTTEYLLDELNLCCKKCHPGQRLTKDCSATSESVCEPCPTGQYIEDMNYSPNCFSCTKCKANKGLTDVQSCSPTTKTKCGCQPGMFCIMGFDDPHCSLCKKYKPCKAGYGVSVAGTAQSDVKCEPCPRGTFSNTVSLSDRCRPHTNCHGRAVVREGNATSDNVCETEANTQPQTSTTKQPEIRIATTDTVTSVMTATSSSEPPREPTYPTSQAVLNQTTKRPGPQGPVSVSILAIPSVLGVALLLIAIILLFCCWKRKWRKDATEYHPKFDANGNCDTGDKINHAYLVETQIASVTSPEQHCLLENGGANSDPCHCMNNTTLTRTDSCGNYNSISPLQSTIALQSPHSTLSEPMTLLSNTESFTPQTSTPPQTSIPPQSPSQPTSPQIISPVATSPHVNVNITFHIGNGSGRTPSVLPTESTQVDSKLPFGEEEESFSIPQQEAGKQSLISVEESTDFCA